MTIVQHNTTVGHTGIARLCLAQQCYRTRTKLAQVGEDVTDYKQFQKCYGDGNYKSFLAICRDIELLEVPKRASNGKFRGYAFDKMKNGKKYKVLKVNRKFYDKYRKMTQESKK